MSITELAGEAAINPKVSIPIATTATGSGLGMFGQLTETMELLAVAFGLLVAVLTCVAQWLKIQKLRREARHEEAEERRREQEHLNQQT